MSSSVINPCRMPIRWITSPVSPRQRQSIDRSMASTAARITPACPTATEMATAYIRFSSQARPRTRNSRRLWPRPVPRWPRPPSAASPRGMRVNDKHGRGDHRPRFSRAMIPAMVVFITRSLVSHMASRQALVPRPLASPCPGSARLRDSGPPDSATVVQCSAGVLPRKAPAGPLVVAGMGEDVNVSVGSGQAVGQEFMTRRPAE